MLHSNFQIRCLILLLSLVFSNCWAQNTALKIDNFWIQAAPPNAKSMAAYATVENVSDESITLLDAYSPAFEMTMIHKTVIIDGIAKMVHQEENKLKPHAKLQFKPGGYHIMLMQPLFKINQGDLIKINLIYLIHGKRVVQETWFPVEFRD